MTKFIAKVEFLTEAGWKVVEQYPIMAENFLSAMSKIRKRFADTGINVIKLTILDNVALKAHKEMWTTKNRTDESKS